MDFTIGGADLVDAIRQAIEDENVVSQDSLDFTDGATEKFEALFFGDGKVYEVYPDIQGDSMEAELRVFVKLPADADDTYMVTGEEEVYFLYVNNGEDTISCSTTVTRTENGKEKEKTTKRITIKSYEDKFGDEERNIISKPAETAPAEKPSEAVNEETTENVVNPTDAEKETTAAEETAEVPETKEDVEESKEQPEETKEEETEAATEAPEEITEPETEAPAETEAAEYRKHPVYGYVALKDEDWISGLVKQIVLYHHERKDRNGFPIRPAEVRKEIGIVSVCDVFDEMICGIGCRRIKVYEAIEYMKVYKGSRFPKEIVDALLQFTAVYPAGSTVLLTNGQTGKVVRQNKDFSDRPVIELKNHDIIDLVKINNVFIEKVLE